MDLYDPTKERPSCRLDLDVSRNELLIAFAPLTTDRLMRIRQIPGRYWDRAGYINRAPLTWASYTRARELFPAFRISTLLASMAEGLIPAPEGPSLVPTDAPQPPEVVISLFPYQRNGVAFLKLLNRALLCDQMRLGKTYQAIAWAAFKPTVGERYGTIVICPAAAKYVWEDQIRTARPSDRIVVVDSATPVPAPRLADWVIINYDRLADRKVRNENRKRKGASGDLAAFGAATLLADESHFIKSSKAKRTKALLSVINTIPRRLMITGTPIVNRPVELFTQLLAAGLVQERDFFKYAREYCNAQKVYVPGVGMRWDFSGSSNEDKLHAWLKPVMLRRLRKEVWFDLPDTVWSNELLPLDPQVAKDYQLAEDDFKAWLQLHGLKAKKSDHLRQLNYLRQIALRGKMAAVVERLDPFRAEQEKAVIFCGFLREGLDKLQEHLAPGEYVRITGDESLPERQEAIARFQTDPTCLFALCSITATGVAVDLSAATAVLFMDLPWSPKIKEQAEDRPQNVERTEKLYVVHLLGKETIDEDMAAVLADKASVIDKVVDGTTLAERTEWGVAEAVERRLAERRK